MPIELRKPCHYCGGLGGKVPTAGTGCVYCDDWGMVEPSPAEVIEWLAERGYRVIGPDGIDYEAGRQVLATFQRVHPDRCQGLADAIVDAALGGER